MLFIKFLEKFRAMLDLKSNYRILCCILLAFISTAYSSQKVETINYEAISRNNFEFLNTNKLFILVLFNDNGGINESEDSVLNEINKKIMSINEFSQDKIELYSAKDNLLNSKYGVFKLPGILFFRHGKYLLYKGMFYTD